MKIIGVGCGPGMLTEQAIREVSRATLIFGSDRAIKLATPYIPANCVVRTIDDFKNLSSIGGDAVILSTGDPMLAGLGYLSGEVIPGISSLQVAQRLLRLWVRGGRGRLFQLVGDVLHQLLELRRITLLQLTELAHQLGCARERGRV